MIARPVAKGLSGLWRLVFLRFLLIGVLNTAFGYSLYAGFLALGLPRAVSLFVATVIGVLFNFKSYGIAVFKDRDNRRILRFIFAYLLTYLFNLGLLELMCRMVGLNSYVGQALCLPPVVCLLFILLKHLVYKKERRTDGREAH